MKTQKVILILCIGFCLGGMALAAEGVHEEAGGEPQGVFSGYWGESFWTLIWFGVLLIVLWKFAWKPLLAGLHNREEHIERQISDAEKIRQDARGVLDEYRAKLADAERQGREIVTQRVRDAEKQAKEVQEQHQKEIERMKVRMEAEIERGRNEAEDALWKQAGDIIHRLGQDVFGKSMNDEDNQKLIQEAIERLKESERQSHKD